MTAKKKSAVEAKNLFVAHMEGDGFDCYSSVQEALKSYDEDLADGEVVNVYKFVKGYVMVSGFKEVE